MASTKFPVFEQTNKFSYMTLYSTRCHQQNQCLLARKHGFLYNRRQRKLLLGTSKNTLFQKHTIAKHDVYENCYDWKWIIRGALLTSISQQQGIFMKEALNFIALSFILTGYAWGQTLELPPEVPACQPTIEEIRSDLEFMRLFQQMPGGLKLSQEPLSPPTIVGTVDWPQLPVATQESQSSLLVAIIVQPLAEIDGIKGMLLQDLRNAETPGYRGTKIVPIAEGQGRGYDYQTDFQSRRYVPSRSNLDWAIHGEGFFMLRRLQPADADESVARDDDDSLFFTRLGRFELTDDHKLCYKRYGEIYLLQPEIDISLLQDVSLDQWPMQLARIDSPEKLWRFDGVLFRANPDEKKPELFAPNRSADTILRQMEYEASNVDVAETLQLYRALHRMQSAMLEEIF